MTEAAMAIVKGGWRALWRAAVLVVVPMVVEKTGTAMAVM